MVQEKNSNVRSFILSIVYYSPFLVAAFAASQGFKTFQFVQFVIAATYLLSLSLATSNLRSSQKWFAGAYLVASGVFFAALQLTLDHRQIFHVLVILTIAYLLCAVPKVSTPQQLVICCGARIMMASSLAILGAMTQSSAMIWGILILGFIPGCFLAAVDLLQSAKLLSDSGWSRVTKSEKNGSEIVRPGSITRALSSLLIVAPGIVLLFLPFGLVPSAVLLIAILFYPALNIVQDFQSSKETDKDIRQRTENAAMLAAALMPIIASFSIGLVSL